MGRKRFFNFKENKEKQEEGDEYQETYEDDEEHA